MGIWFLILVILIALVILVTIYLYDNSPFKKMTNYSYFQVIFNSEIRSFFKLYRVLKNADKMGKLLLNVKLPQLNNVISAIYIHSSGVYIINLKNTNGWLYGHEKAMEWTLVKYKEKQYKIQNPIIQNQRETEAVQNTSSLNNPNLFHSAIVFSDNTVLKKLSIQTDNVNIVNLHDLKAFLKKQNGQHLSETEIDNVFKTFERYTVVPEWSQQNGKMMTN